MSIHLTDDEIVALAVLDGRAWGGRIPTVDTSGVEPLADAVGRGQRSLVARGLAAGGTVSDPPEIPALRSVAGSVPMVMLYAALMSSVAMPLSRSAEIYQLPGAADYLLDVAVPGGLHEIAVLSADDVSTFVLNLAREVHTSGFGDDDGGSRRLVHIDRRSSEPTVTLIARAETVRGVGRPNGESFEFLPLDVPVEPDLADLALSTRVAR